MYLSEIERKLYKKMYNNKYFQEKLKFTKKCIKEMLRVSNSYVSFSFGKDSIVMSHIIRQIVPDIPHIFTYHDETEFILHTEDVDVNGVNLKKIKLSNTPFDKKGLLMEVHLRPPSQEFLDEIKKYDGVFKGIRADEAKYRKFAVYNRKDSYMVHTYDLTKKSENWFRKYSCFPIGLWKDIDIKIYLSYWDLFIPREYNTEDRTSAGITSAGNYDTNLQSKVEIKLGKN